MHILLSNDDGFDANGLQILRSVLSRRHRVDVVAPDAEKSGCGHSITVGRPIFINPVEGIGWEISGTPADCVKLGVEALLPSRPDLVVSGINHGSNLGRDIFYSGTVSAAIEAAFMDIPALAVSAAGFTQWELEWIAHCVDWWISRQDQDGIFAPGKLFNLNFPAFAGKQPPAVLAHVRLGRRDYRNEYELRPDAAGRRGYWMVGRPHDLLGDESTDVQALASGMVTLTPIALDLSDFEALGAGGGREEIPPAF